MKVTGQCHCGAVSFTALIDPARVIACHCADCQVFSGAPYRAVLPTPSENVDITGEYSTYVKTAASGTRRAQTFCSTCGTQLYAADANDAPEVLNLRVGCINERVQLSPKVQIWGHSAMPWLGDIDAVPMHEEGLASPVMAPPGDAP
ncbi:GFA family protein [Hydrogenophaga sp. 5NK40-0174]|uniref:GFA family protein n=1 Tax=Hydrogenophaga sp. 5NK40-0174 TaxID=3127649 RepID=UPI00310A5789